MKVNEGWKELYKKLSCYNRQRFIEANRPFVAQKRIPAYPIRPGRKDPKEFIKMLMWFLAVLFIIGIVLVIGK